jgi:hypothetical protein
VLAQSRFSEAQLHNTLCGLSYTGDVRMAIAEDASKVRVCALCLGWALWPGADALPPHHQVQRIATGSAGPLRQMYRGAIARASAWRAALVRFHSHVAQCALL